MATTTTSITEDGLVLYPEKSSLERLRFFFGQLLTQRDLEAEQRYHLTMRRLTQRETFGTGTVAGLGVTEAGQDVAPLSVFVHPGLAFDPDGRELILEAMECIPVAEASVPGAGEEVEGGDHPAVAAFLGGLGVFDSPITGPDVEELEAALRECGLLASDSNIDDLKTALGNIPQAPVALEPPIILRDYLFDQLVGVTFVGLRYREVSTDPAPAVLDASCCGGVSCFPTRTSQGVYIAVSSDPFPAIEDPYTRLRECIDSQFFEQMEAGGPGYPVDPKAALCACLTSTGAWRGLPPTDEACGTPSLPIVPLAKVCWRRFDDEVLPNILHVENCFWRPLAPGVPAIRALLESYASGVRPENLLPRVVEISPKENEVFAKAVTEDGFLIAARMDSTMVWPSITSEWELVAYQTDGVFAQYSGVVGPGGSTAAVTLDDSRLVFQLTFTSGSGFPPGTYVWRFPIAPGDLTSTANGQTLDGQPNPPKAVPSGNAAPGGVFEARFVVVAD
jgi:hypothetical protein